MADKWVSHFGLSKAWLLTGEGEMLNAPATENAAPPAHMEDGAHLPVLDVDYKLVPIIHIDSVGGIHSSNDIIEEPEYIEGYVPFTGARDGDLVIHESGDSMAPTIPAGSLMLIRRVEGHVSGAAEVYLHRCKGVAQGMATRYGSEQIGRARAQQES